MSFRLATREASAEGLRRIALEQLERASGEVSDRWTDCGETIHQVRKRCKKVRSILRLMRPVIDDYKTENQRLRDLARTLSDPRDSDALLETFSHFLDEKGGNDRGEVEPIIQFLKENQKRAFEELSAAGVAEEYVLQRLRKSHERLHELEIDASGSDVWSGGLRKTYHRGRKALTQILDKDEPTGADFHELRKRAKYHWYHLSLLRNLWPRIVKAQRKEADRLASALGDHHDLIVLGNFLDQHEGDINAPDALAKTRNWIATHRLQLERVCLRRARLLYAEKPGKLTKRFVAYAKAQQLREKTEASY